MLPPKAPYNSESQPHHTYLGTHSQAHSLLFFTSIPETGIVHISCSSHALFYLHPLARHTFSLSGPHLSNILQTPCMHAPELSAFIIHSSLEAEKQSKAESKAEKANSRPIPCMTKTTKRKKGKKGKVERYMEEKGREEKGIQRPGY